MLSLKALAPAIWNNLGHCITCMRQALTACILLTSIAAVSLWFIGGPVAYAASLLAAGAFALSLAHVAAFAVRLTLTRLEIPRSSQTTDAPDRRRAFRIFAKALAFSALLTAAPSLAFGADATKCPSCSHGHCYNADTDECVCKARDDEVCCYSQTSTWRCLSDQVCSSYNGDCNPR